MFYDNFIALCTEKAVTPSAVMRAIGLNKSSASYWKKGSTPSTETLQKLAEYFNVSVDYLLGVYTPMEGITVSGDPDDVATVKELFENATQTGQAQTAIDRSEYTSFLEALGKLSHSDWEIINAMVKRMAEEQRPPMKPIAFLPAKTVPESTPAPQEGKDTAPPSDVPEMLPEKPTEGK